MRRRTTSVHAVVLLVAALLLSTASCSSPMITLPGDDATREAQNQAMYEAIKSLGQDGDWLAIRGYKAGDEVVLAATNSPISHVAVLDLTGDQVIEATADGVHTTPLMKFMNKAHRLLLIRPVWAKGEAGKEAVDKALGLVGKKYDWLGTVGADNPNAYYCSELAIKVYQKHQTTKDLLPDVIEPAHIYLWGTILYDSRPRHWSGEVQTY